ncbi:hypothetical protein MNBD_BACTEROID01-2631 [hydrothermal vent metagenome]|uniref:Uncharacterized protein n=1 Tax=hydrothermal vent metagenome TaxID=652676 RepID=A0A3B0U7U3_9ZZZZ
MKTLYFIFTTIIFLAFSEIVIAESITIQKANQNDPSEVCNETEYNYTATLSGLKNGVTYSVKWIPVNGYPTAVSMEGATIKWQATTAADGYKGTLKAKLMKGDNEVASDELSVTIKSIKHLKPGFTPYYTR